MSLRLDRIARMSPRELREEVVELQEKNLQARLSRRCARLQAHRWKWRFILLLYFANATWAAALLLLLR